MNKEKIRKFINFTFTVITDPGVSYYPLFFKSDAVESVTILNFRAFTNIKEYFFYNSSLCLRCISVNKLFFRIKLYL